MYDQLGYYSNNNQTTPKQVGTDTNWNTISLGIYHAGAIKNDNSLWTWGSNYYGEAGHGSSSSYTNPEAVDCYESVMDIIEFSGKDQLTYYPNPVKQNLHISSLKNIQKVVVFSIVGQEVMTKSLNSNSIDLDFSQLPAGVYHIKVLTNENTNTLKIIKK